MEKLTKRKLKSIKKAFQAKEKWHKLRENPDQIKNPHSKNVKFLHRAPSGDARQKESLLKLMINRVDIILIITSFISPPLKTGLVDRMLIMAGIEEVEPLIILNKADLLTHRREGEKTANLYRSLGYQALCTSTVTGEGMDYVKDMIRGRSSLLAGHSGVGKSSILNFIEPSLTDQPDVREVSLANMKGRHTTTTIKLYRLSDGSFIYDLPGLKYASLYDLKKTEIQNYFPEFASPSRHCRYPDCVHRDEPHCGVKKGVEEGIINRERYESYIRILGSSL